MVILIIAVALLLFAVAVGLIVLAAVGIGWVLVNWIRLPFAHFEASLLSLIALIPAGWLAGQVINLTPFDRSTSPDQEDDEEDEDLEDWDDEEEEDDGEQAPVQVQSLPSIPKWRQPIRRASDGLPIVDPDDRCPCGSGRKYKNWHGKK